MSPRYGLYATWIVRVPGVGISRAYEFHKVRRIMWIASMLQVATVPGTDKQLDGSAQG
jgi:hypothetical protein